MRLIIQPDYDQLSVWTARYIASKINKFGPTKENPFVLGLPTGSSPIGTYKEMVRLVQAGKVSFDHVITFNMDEYVHIEEGHPESYHSFMRQNLFNHIGIPEENINILNGNAEDLVAECEAFEAKIKSVGGIRLFLGGIGPDGHIAFNEPGSSLHSKTRVKTLTYDTRIANSRFFNNDIEAVPKLALTVGVGTVTDSMEVVLIVNGHSKARALYKMIEEGVNHMWTASALQLHPKSMVVCDEDATYELQHGTYKYFKDIEQENLTPSEL
ncbi:MAG: glucosamine-6-phosphate deaminase [Candidatus Marinimicrobia bacterium]|nr:glucosamine-6-phosphate deaminase [Candidatus Neomarinimicrobiota bacterium]MCF7904602.1 glucosamine-6-phosphate deaminase [Candidatus Neomarinimicrobiota bacterium]